VLKEHAVCIIKVSTLTMEAADFSEIFVPMNYVLRHVIMILQE
jgi:hypothetical protein